MDLEVLSRYYGTREDGPEPVARTYQSIKRKIERKKVEGR
jgi:hypothetical protein